MDELYPNTSCLKAFIGNKVILFMAKKKHCPNYGAFFVIGLAFIPISIATENYAFLGVSFAFIILAISHKDKWKTCDTKTKKKAKK